jgi:hypothetical protein
MTQIVHKEDGYWVNYYYEADPIIGQISTSLLIYLRSNSTNLNEIHVKNSLLSCLIVLLSRGK